MVEIPSVHHGGVHGRWICRALSTTKYIRERKVNNNCTSEKENIKSVNQTTSNPEISSVPLLPLLIVKDDSVHVALLLLAGPALQHPSPPVMIRKKKKPLTVLTTQIPVYCRS